MRRITQTKPNCWSVCLACLLDMPEEDVPDFVGMTDDYPWLDLAREWLADRGIAVLVIHGGDDPLNALPCDLVAANVLWVAGGPPGACDVERSERHAVIYRGGELEWDPHPSKVGLAAVHTVFAFLPISPADIRHHECMSGGYPVGKLP